jgi:hypothetical protein
MGHNIPLLFCSNLSNIGRGEVRETNKILVMHGLPLVPATIIVATALKEWIVWV